MRFLLLNLPILVLLLSTRIEDSHGSQSMRLWDGWDGENVTYPSILVESYEEDLETRRFDNLASAACINLGLWLFYEHQVYNSYTQGLVAALWGEDACYGLPEEISDKVSSVRYSGPPVDHRQDSIQLYEKEWFSDTEYYHLFDQSSTEDRVSSAIVTGATPWTLYELPLYQGESVCVFPGEDRNPGLYPSLAQINATWPFVYSMKKGCFSDNKIMPTSIKLGEILTFG